MKKPLPPKIQTHDLRHHKIYSGLWIVLSAITFGIIFLNLSDTITEPTLTGSIVKDDSLADIGTVPHSLPANISNQGGTMFFFFGLIAILVVIAAGFFTRFIIRH